MKSPIIIRDSLAFPLLDLYKKHFNLREGGKGVIFAYGDTIYSTNPISEDKLIHEICHLEQQRKYGLDTWVQKYLNNPQFRLQMEVEAYRTQLRSIKDRNKRVQVMQNAIEDISSSLYGSMVHRREAALLLSNK